MFQEEIHLHTSVSLLQVDQVAERRQSLAAVESLNVRRSTLKLGSIAKVTLVFYQLMTNIIIIIIKYLYSAYTFEC